MKIKKCLKVIISILVAIILLGLIFFTVDYIRIKNSDTPIFCIKNSAGIYMDGGTIEYFGLGYKIIDFNKLGGYDEIKIGTWFMRYEDFESEYQNEEFIPKEVSKVVLMYQIMLDNIIEEDKALNCDAKYISIDIDSFVAPEEILGNNLQSKYMELEDNEKQMILEYCKKYNNEVKDLSMEELKQNELFNEETMSLDGILIYVSEVEKVTKNRAIITMTKYRSGLGAIYPKYELKYDNNKWSIEVLEMAII